jgi:MYXO-CTERM domain-containing protein
VLSSSNIFNNGGSVGIGQTSPSANFDVSGYTHVSGACNPTTPVQGAYIGWNALSCGTGETDFINNQGAGTGGFAFFNTPPSGSSRSLITRIDGSGNFYAASYNTLSDITMKKDVELLGSVEYAAALDSIRRIDSIRFRYLAESADPAEVANEGYYRPVPHLGVSAQSLPPEVVAHVPAGMGGSDSEKLGVNLADMAGLLVAGVKALDEKQQKLEEKIAAAPAASCVTTDAKLTEANARIAKADEKIAALETQIAELREAVSHGQPKQDGPVGAANERLSSGQGGCSVPAQPGGGRDAGLFLAGLAAVLAAWRRRRPASPG